MTVSTTAAGNWYSMEGTRAEVVAELNRINAKHERVISGGNITGTITLFVKRIG